jgi:hypothetical protein
MSEHDVRDDYDDEPWRPRNGSQRFAKEIADIMWSFGMFHIGASMVCGGSLVSAAIAQIRSATPAKPGFFPTIIGLTLASVSGIAVGVVVARGSRAMARSQNYVQANTAAILTLLSLPYVFTAPFTIPLGIMALAVLRRPEIRARFDAVARAAHPTKVTEDS